MEHSAILTKRTDRLRPSTYISVAKRVDAPQLARVHLLAFHGSTHQPAFFPHRVGMTIETLLSQDGPVDEQVFRRKLVGNDIMIKATVKVRDEAGGEKEIVVGFATWTSPNGGRRRSLWDWLWSEIFYPLYDFLFRVDLSRGRLNPETRTIMVTQKKAVFGRGGVLAGRKHWYLGILCVEPSWQGLGVGGALLEWGMNKAREGNSAIYLESSPTAFPIYLAKGFRTIIEDDYQVNGITIRLPGMLWEPFLGNGESCGAKEVSHSQATEIVVEE